MIFGARVALSASRKSDQRRLRAKAERDARFRQAEYAKFLDRVADRTPLVHRSVEDTPAARYWFKRLHREYEVKITGLGGVVSAIGFLLPMVAAFSVEPWFDYFTAEPTSALRVSLLFGTSFFTGMVFYGIWDVISHRWVIGRINKSLRASKIDVDSLLEEMHRDYTAKSARQR